MVIEPYVHKVQYYETDQMGIVHHSNYIRWFEEARVDILEKLDMAYDQMEIQGIMIPVLGVHCEYKSMVHFGESVLILPRVKSYDGIRLRLSYTIIDALNHQLKTLGHSDHCFMDLEQRLVSLRRKRPDLHERFQQLAQVRYRGIDNE